MMNSGAASVAKVTHDAAADRWPSISHNGRWLVFSRGFGDHHDIWLMDMRSGTESILVSSPFDNVSPLIDDSGQVVVFETHESKLPSIVAMTRDRQPHKVCDACSNPTGWFDDGKALFYREGVPSRIGLAFLASGEHRVALQDGHISLGDADWSPENEYLVFSATSGGEKQIFAIRFPRKTGIAVGERIPITSGSVWGDRPKWSGDGKTVFYLSTRDGFPCVWGQHFDPAEGKLRGDPFPVFHYHNPRASPGTVVSESFNLSVTGDSVYLNVGEARVIIWTAVLKNRSWWWPDWTQ
jgi:Tol biopolymer transport system component